MNYDAKHLVKQIRSSLIGGNVGEGRILLKTDLKKILDLAPNNLPHSIESHLNPKDKQNVPLGTQLLLLYSHAVTENDK